MFDFVEYTIQKKNLYVATKANPQYPPPPGISKILRKKLVEDTFLDWVRVSKLKEVIPVRVTLNLLKCDLT